MSIEPPPFAKGVQWIWSSEGVSLPRPDKGPYRVRYFRRAFDLPQPAARLTVHVSADSRYKLWCNGTLVSRGPAKGDLQHQFYDTIDVSPHLRAGRNVLAAQVEYYGDVWCHYGTGGAPVAQMTACPAFVLDGRLVDQAGVELELLHTDKRWKVLVDEAYFHQGEGFWCHCVGMMEDFAAERYPWGFTEPDFDDAAWPAATELWPALRLEDDYDSPLPFRLVPRMIAPLEESAPRPFARAFRPAGPVGEEQWQAMLAGQGSVTVPPGQQVQVRLDVGELTTAYPRLEFSGGAGGAIRVTYAEALTDPGRQPLKVHRDDLAFGDVHGYADIIRPDGQRRAYEPFFWRTFRFVKLDITTAQQPLALHGIAHAFTGYPFRRLAEVQTSDPRTQAICDVSWRTARLCAHETYEDCPYYEQMQYGGDTQVQAMVSYVVAGDASLARQWLTQFDWSRQPSGLTRSRYPSRVPQTIPLFSLHWVLAVYDYWTYTGDRRSIAEWLPGVRAVLDFYRRKISSDGMVGPMRGWMYADWSPQWLRRDGGPSGCPPGAYEGRSSFVGILAAAAMARGAELCRARGQDGADLSQCALSLRQAVHRLCFDERRGLYLDIPGGAAASAYTNAWAVLADMPCDHARLADAVVTDAALSSLTYFSAYFAWRALAAAGRYVYMARLLQPWRDMLGMGLSTWVEDPRGDRSECHAWGCGPLIEYHREVLGVRPAKPGYEAILIEPKPTGLTWARGRVPLTRLDGSRPARFVCVDWRIDGGQMIVCGDSPQGIPCRIQLPVGPARELGEGGRFELSCELSADI